MKRPENNLVTVGMPEHKQEKIPTVLDCLVEEIKKCKNQADYQLLKEKLINEYPDEKEVIEITFEFRNILEIERKLWEYRRLRKEAFKKEELRDKFQDLAQWNFLTTFFISHAGQNKEYVEKFWISLNALNNVFEPKFHYLEPLKRGIVGQVAINRILEKHGGKMSDPLEDAFEGIDFFLPEEWALQVKCREGLTNVIWVEADRVAFPNIRLDKGKTSIYFTDADLLRIVRLGRSCEQISRRTGRKIKAVYVILPEAQIDPDTGEPQPDLIKEVEEKLLNQ